MENKINKINNNDTKENSVIDITSIYNQQTEPVLVKLQWTKNYETIFADWCDKAMSYRYLHSECNRYYNQYNNIVTIPVIIISTMTGVANFAQSRVPEDYVPYFKKKGVSLVIRLNKSYRAIYVELDNGQIQFIEIIEVNINNCNFYAK